ETVSIRWVAEEFGRMLGQQPAFIHEEQNTALLSNAAEAYRLFGYPKVPLKQIMNLLVEWIKQGGKVLNKPTLFQERQGKF
ncbi:MAG TPA: epimerase, partial [Puia sp.]|nr:epimerase [Puia sp.]